jgi:methionine-rich copper-binding protein CopC
LEASRREEVVKARWLLMATLGALVVGIMALAGTAWAVPDGTPPMVQGTNPADGATNVALDAKIKVKFSEPMKDGTINPTNIYITVGEGTETMVVPAKVDYVDEITPVRAVLKPLAPLEPNTTYTVVVEGTGDGDMKAVKDASGTPLAHDYTFSFTTGTSCATCPPPV